MTAPTSIQNISRCGYREQSQQSPISPESQPARMRQPLTPRVPRARPTHLEGCEAPRDSAGGAQAQFELVLRLAPEDPVARNDLEKLLTIRRAAKR